MKKIVLTICAATVWTAVASEAKLRRDFRTGRYARTVLIAAFNSEADDKAAADLVCTGTNDERVLNAAIASLRKGGTIQLLDGDYHVDEFANEGNSAIYFGYNGGAARVINLVGTTENKSYNTRFGVTIHVTKPAMDKMRPDGVYRLIYGAAQKPKAEGDFYTYTHVNNVNVENLFLFFFDASKPLRGIDGSNFGQMYLKQVGVFTENYFRDRFLHLKPAMPAKGSIGVYSVPGSNDEMSRIGYDYVNVGGLYIGFTFNKVDHLILRACSAARCCYGYWFVGGPKTLTLINCADEGNTHLPRFCGRGHVTALDFNIERFNAAYIPDSPDGDVNHRATEEIPGGWHGTFTYTIQGNAYGVQNKPEGSTANFWEPGHGRNFRTVNQNDDACFR
ncbi:MAG: hypothetical protein RBT78_11075 [Kiritimatiellia bacterium]|nr:hypothetical protein [Kiritimatiellia bacterium]